MDSISPKVTQKVSMLFENKHANTAPSQQETQHSTSRPTSDNTTACRLALLLLLALHIFQLTHFSPLTTTHSRYTMNGRAKFHRQKGVRWQRQNTQLYSSTESNGHAACRTAAPSRPNNRVAATGRSAEASYENHAHSATCWR